MSLSRCILTAMDGHLNLALISACTARPSSGQIIDFYINALRVAPGFRRGNETRHAIWAPNEPICRGIRNCICAEESPVTPVD
jgi:hypothetical protein